MRTSRSSWCAVMALAGAVALAGCGSGDDVASPASAEGWHGEQPQPVPDRPRFTLTDTNGKPFDFYGETAGEPTLVYFGYTNCPDECPTAMADIAAALRQSGGEVREETNVVLITTDPDRDTGKVLRAFLDQFDENFIGLTGNQDEVDAAQQAVGFRPATKAGPVPTLPGRPNEHAHKPGTAPHTHAGPLGYGVDHANVIFAYSASDKLPVIYTPGTTASDIAADLPRLARGNA